MLPLATDEDVHEDIVRGLRRRILLVALGYTADEMKDQVLYVPF